MSTIDLNQEQTSLLCQTLESSLVSLRFEIARTDDRSFRKMLENRQVLLEQILARIR
jgi:hypothetical protein